MSVKPYFSHKKTRTKDDLTTSLYNEIGYSKKYSAELVDFCFETIKNKLASNHNVKISSFGHFVLRDKKQRLGRNPTTGQAMAIDPRRVVTFRASASLIKKIKCD